jgi:thiamine kinase-like enzyme
VHARITAELLARRPWLIHGELYASNVLLESAGAAIRPVDWEMIGIGPRLLDLAALTSGRLADAARESLIEAYRGALSDAGAPDPGDAPFRRELTACRLLLAVQWLGWGRGWRPPREHRHDWLDEAVRCARGLEGA